MAVTLRLKRFGRLNHPTYRVVATDPRFPRDGRIIESLGYYLPLFPREGEQVKLNTERVEYWLSVGARPSETVAAMIERSGVELPAKKKRKRGKSKAEPKPFAPPTRRKNKQRLLAKAKAMEERNAALAKHNEAKAKAEAAQSEGGETPEAES
ncbi:MAG: 30S ribosomal protein S16 [Planctomycetes bacterium]|nr:30S ribosomal protein S16 [Planctomycetota bacterium]